MKNKFDELAKGLAQSVTRRGALRKFGFGLAGVALAYLVLATKAQADNGVIRIHCQCKKADFGCYKSADPQLCFSQCGIYCSQPH